MIEIIVDADACPVMNEIDILVKKYNLNVTYITDTSHNIVVDYGTVIIVDKGSDSADYKVLSLTNKTAIIVTQDYALASLCLTKGASVIHTNSFIIDNSNIDSLLSSRYLNQKARKARVKTINPKKRKQEDNFNFYKLLDNLINDKIRQNSL